MSLGKYLYNYIKENGELTYEKLETICKGNNPMNKWFKTDTGRRALNDYEDIRPETKPGANYIWRWVYKPQTPLRNQASDEVKSGSLDIFSLKQAMEEKKKQEFINNLK